MSFSGFSVVQILWDSKLDVTNKCWRVLDTEEMGRDYS